MPTLWGSVTPLTHWHAKGDCAFYSADVEVASGTGAAMTLNEGEDLEGILFVEWFENAVQQRVVGTAQP